LMEEVSKKMSSSEIAAARKLGAEWDASHRKKGGA